MELIRYLHNIRTHHQDCVVSIGNFDGVHIGHQAVIQQLRRYAKQLNLPAVVMIFEPQPLEFFSPDTAPARLTALRDKIEWLSEHGIDRVVCLRFQKSLANLSAKDFVEQLLVRALGVKYIIQGDDFRFGKGREGDFQMLQEFGEQYGFEAISITTLTENTERVSSSRIRELLAQGQLNEARILLGRAFSISGRVIHGDKRGRTLGCPTANMALRHHKPPLMGIYIVKVDGLDKIYNGVASIGTRPVFDGKQLLLEVHLLDFDKDIYGKHLHVDFLKFLRPEQSYKTVDELQKQMQEDIELAREFFDELN